LCVGCEHVLKVQVCMVQTFSITMQSLVGLCAPQGTKSSMFTGSMREAYSASGISVTQLRGRFEFAPMGEILSTLPRQIDNCTPIGAALGVEPKRLKILRNF